MQKQQDADEDIDPRKAKLLTKQTESSASLASEGEGPGTSKAADRQAESTKISQQLDDEIERLERELWGVLANLEKICCKLFPSYQALSAKETAARHDSEAKAEKK